MGIPHAILAGLVARFNSSWQDHSGPAWFGVALIYFYVLMYSLSYGPLGWSLIAEVRPLDYQKTIADKSTGLAQQQSCQRCCHGGFSQLDFKHDYR